MAKVLGAGLQVPHPQQDQSLDFQGLSIPHNQVPPALGLAWDPREDMGNVDPQLAFSLEMTNPQAPHPHLLALAATECELQCWDSKKGRARHHGRLPGGGGEGVSSEIPVGVPMVGK